MNPAERGVPQPLRLGEAEADQFLLQLRLDGRGKVDVAGHHVAARMIFDGGAADQNRARQSTLAHRFIELREQIERPDQLGAVRAGGMTH